MDSRVGMDQLTELIHNTVGGESARGRVQISAKFKLLLRQWLNGTVMSDKGTTLTIWPALRHAV